MSFVYLSITKLFDKINNSIHTTLGHPALISALGYIYTTLTFGKHFRDASLLFYKTYDAISDRSRHRP